MSFPAPGQAAIGEELRDEGGVRKALLNWFAAQGINPFQNPYAARLVGRAGEVAQLMPGYFQQDSDRQNFINSWAAQQWGGAAPGGGLDFSNKGILGQLDQTRDVNGTPVNLFRTGDSDADAATMAAWRNIANRTYGSQIQNTASRLEAEKGLQFGAWRQQNPTWSGQYADWRLGKTPSTTPFTPPAGGTGTGTTTPATGLPPVNPNLTTFPSAPGNPWQPLTTPPAGGTTPTAPGTAPQPSTNQNMWVSNPNSPYYTNPNQTLPAGANANAQYGTGQQSPTTVPNRPAGPAWQPKPGLEAGGGPWAATQNAATLLRNLPYQTMQGFENIANARTQAGHRTGPGVSSADLGYGVVYDAPADVQRRYWEAGSTGREPGGQAKGDSGWRLLQDRMRQLQAQGMTYQQALMNTMEWFSRQAKGGDISRYGFRRAG